VLCTKRCCEGNVCWREQRAVLRLLPNSGAGGFEHGCTALLMPAVGEWALLGVQRALPLHPSFAEACLEEVGSLPDLVLAVRKVAILAQSALALGVIATRHCVLHLCTEACAISLLGYSLIKHFEAALC